MKVIANRKRCSVVISRVQSNSAGRIGNFEAVAAACVSANSLRMSAIVDDEMTIYSEGVVVAATSTPASRPTTVTIDDPCVLAIRGKLRQT